MTVRTASRTSKPSTKKPAPKPAKTVRAGKSDLAGRIKIRSVYERALFAAAFTSQTDAVFGAACAGAVKAALGAADVAIIGASGASESVTVVSTSGALATALLSPRPNCPLRACFRTAKPLLVDLGAANKKPVKHEPALTALKFKSYGCLPLIGPKGKPVALIVVGFKRQMDLGKIAAQFDIDLSVPLAAAMYSRRKEIKADTLNQFSSLAKTIPGVVYQRIVKMNGDIRYTFLSEGARELFGVDPEAVIKDPDVLFRTYADDYRRTFRENLVAASKALTTWDVEASVVLPDGRNRHTHAIARPERVDDETVLWTGVILDATRAKEAEESLKSANRLVGLANQAKSAFLAKMSHEMRTPLNGVLGMGDLLLKTDLSPRQTRLATTLCDSARSLLGIINDVLDLSRIEAGHFKLDMQDFNLRHCVEDAVELCATSGYRKGLEINLIVATNTPVGVKSDPVRLRQVLINLIGNAIKFTEAGEVVVRIGPTETADGKVAVDFEVIDTGIGIDASAITRLFEPFAQADSTISRRFGGTGLGLSITRHLVELLGGTVKMTSEKGRGTTVRFSIPFEVTATAETATILNQISLSTVRALVVDDRETNREMLMGNLAGSGARADGALSETEALSMIGDALASGDPYGVVIVDRVRPRFSGLHLCRTIRSNPRFAGTGVIALMSANWNANPIDQQGLGNTIFLSKPARRTDLLAAVARTQNPDLDIGSFSHGAFQPPQQHRGVAPQLKLRVLLVEDNQTNIEVAREYLSELDCRVTVAVNGIEAIAAYDRSRFDVILMDSQMPELDGLSATRRIRESERLKGEGRTPIIAVTANAYESDRAQALEAGSDDFLSKPFTDMQLRGMLEKWGVDNKIGEQDAASSAAHQIAVDTVLAIKAPAPGVAAAAAATASAPPPATTIVPAETQLDTALHTVLLRNRPAFLGRLIRAFLSSVPEALIALRTAVSHSDPDLLRSIAHSLKSSSANVGAKRLSEQCRALEMKLRLGAEPADCETLAADIANELAMTERALEKLLTQLAAPDAMPEPSAAAAV